MSQKDYDFDLDKAPSFDDLKARVNKIPIADDVKDYLLECLKRDINLCNSLEEAQIVLKRWRWLAYPTKDFWKAFKSLLDVGAGTVKQIVDKRSALMLASGLEFPSDSQAKSMRQKYIAVYKYLFGSNVITAITLDETQLPRGKKSVRVWIAPDGFRLENDVKKAIDEYIGSGGRNITMADKKRKKSKKDYENSAERELNYRETVNKKKIQRKAKKMAKMGFYFYECPNCGSIIKISKNNEHLYTIEDTKLLEPCTCGNKFRERITA